LLWFQCPYAIQVFFISFLCPFKFLLCGNAACGEGKDAHSFMFTEQCLWSKLNILSSLTLEVCITYGATNSMRFGFPRVDARRLL
jgi:hypothetical protein